MCKSTDTDTDLGDRVIRLMDGSVSLRGNLLRAADTTVRLGDASELRHALAEHDIGTVSDPRAKQLAREIRRRWLGLLGDRS